MKIVIDNYTFDKTAKTVTFTDIAVLRLDRILLVVNVTREIVLYNLTDPALGGTVGTNVLTLTYDTSAQVNTDKLLIYYENGQNVTTLQAAAVASGNGTSLPVTGYAVAILNVVSSPAMSGGTTINFEVSVDDTTWVSIVGHQIGVSGSLAISTTTDGDFRFSVAGYKSLRARISAYSAGTVTVKGYASPLAGVGTAVSVDATSGMGANVGTTTGVAVTSDATGTLQQYLRGLIKILATVWDSTNNWLNIRRVKKDTYAASSAFTITLASLASSTAGVGRQSTILTSQVTESAIITVKFTVGTTPTINTTVDVYLIRGDDTYLDDGAGVSDAGLTLINAPLLGRILVNAVTSNVAYYGVFDTKFLGSLGPRWGIAIVNGSGVTANATGGNFDARYTLIS